MAIKAPKKEKVDSYFLNQQSPFSKKRTLNTWTIKIVAALVITAMIAVLFVTGNSSDDTKNLKPSSVRNVQSANKSTSEAISRSMAEGAPYLPNGYQSQAGGSAQPLTIPPRQYTSSQIVRREGHDLGGAASLSLATTIPAKLINTVVSSDSVSPVIAEISEGALDSGSSLVIPSGTRAIGQASYDDVTRRLQVRFHALVLPDGEERAFSGLALLGDGSAGLEGEYHSERLTKQAGRFLGTFAGGFADGMKDRQMTPSGQPMEKGSIKNGLLNGLSSSAFAEAQGTAQDLQQTRPYLEVSAGTTFLIYLDKGFSP